MNDLEREQADHAKTRDELARARTRIEELNHALAWGSEPHEIPDAAHDQTKELLNATAYMLGEALKLLGFASVQELHAAVGAGQVAA